MKAKISLLILPLLLIAAGDLPGREPGFKSLRLTVTGAPEKEGLSLQAEPRAQLTHKVRDDYDGEAGNVLTATATDSTVFDLRYMTDSAYSNMYSFWQEVPVSAGCFYTPFVGDVDKDGRSELYGYQKFFTTWEETLHAAILEEDILDTFRLAYTYGDSVIRPSAKYDIDLDGNQELVYHTRSGQFRVFRSAGAGYPPTIPSFGVNPYAGISQVNDLTFGDFDGNGKTDAVFYLPSVEVSMFVSEYNPASNTLDTVYRFRPPMIYTEGFSVGDYDQDTKTDIVMGSAKGDVYLVECEGMGSYQHVWTGKVETYNAYLHLKTNDIDGNGKPEFWVGGDAFYHGLGQTRFTCFEADGDNTYRAVHRIDFVGVFSFNAGNCFAVDIDTCGREEMFICIDGHVLIVKFTGAPNSHQYIISFMKLNELLLQGLNSAYYGATLCDVTGDGKPELIITMDQIITGQGRREFTRIYKPAVIADVRDGTGGVPTGYQLHQNYPNPFNSGTVIRYVVPSGGKAARIVLRVYDTVGREIRNLLDHEQPPGEHELRWDGRTDAGGVVGSGVYVIVMQAGSYTKAVKALFLK